MVGGTISRSSLMMNARRRDLDINPGREDKECMGFFHPKPKGMRKFSPGI
jgi:hypothetical protein